MKLRIKGNSIRLRLTQSEVSMIAALKSVRESTALSNAVFYCELRASNDGKFDAVFFNSSIVVEVPKEILSAWAISEQVGINAELSNGLTILIEKDFKCLTERKPDEDFDTFPNPHAAHNC